MVKTVVVLSWKHNIKISHSIVQLKLHFLLSEKKEIFDSSVDTKVKSINRQEAVVRIMCDLLFNTHFPGL